MSRVEVEDGRRRVIIEGVEPEIDAGRFAAKRVLGDILIVEADIFADGHDAIAALLLYRPEGEDEWRETPMDPLVNDRWRGTFSLSRLGRYEYTLRAWVDHFLSWQRDLRKRAVVPDEDLSLQFEIGRLLIRDAITRAGNSPDVPRLERYARVLEDDSPRDEKLAFATEPALLAMMMRYPDRSLETEYRTLRVIVDRERARFSTWYELFPRSTATEAGRHGTFRDVAARLPYVSSMGFDVLYVPPIHPIGTAYRKGPNNTLTPGPNDPGSPWAIGGPEGGHLAIHPELGTIEDFRALRDAARSHGMELALDIAFQASPDHPHVKEHPEFFRRRPDGTIQYAENPPKKYQDIYPYDFESVEWRAMWQELLGVFVYWCGEGIRIFRVDNPHTKALPFWEWVIGEVKRQYPDTIFLAEAFTRPKIMDYLAKAGFTQSYTYFAWRNAKWEIEEYFTHLTKTKAREYFRPNAWPNTPDILTEFLQHGGRPAFMSRLVLAATLCASYGIYGPTFELQVNTPRDPGSEEYLDSEKYQIQHWNLDQQHSLRDFIARVNRVRRENRALHTDWSLFFHPTSNDQVICYSKATRDRANVILVVVNLDPYNRQSAWIDLDLRQLGVQDQQSFQMHDHLSASRFLWHGSRNFVDLDPHRVPAHIFQVRRFVRKESDFDYFS